MRHDSLKALTFAIRGQQLAHVLSIPVCSRARAAPQQLGRPLLPRTVPGTASALTWWCTQRQKFEWQDHPERGTQILQWKWRSIQSPAAIWEQRKMQVSQAARCRHPDQVCLSLQPIFMACCAHPRPHHSYSDCSQTNWSTASITSQTYSCRDTTSLVNLPQICIFFIFIPKKTPTTYT